LDFGLTEEQQLLQQTVAGFLANECPATRIREIFESDDGFDETLWKGMVELGLGGLALPESYGGAGLDILDLALVAETLGAGAAPGPFLGHALAGIAIAAGGSEEQKSRWLPKLATGDLLGSVALAGEDGGWLPDDWSLAPGGSLTGTKRFVPYASQADLIVVGTAGGGLSVVARNASGLETSGYAGVDRTRRLGELAFSSTPVEVLEGGGAERLRDVGLVLLAADALGGASRCVEMAVEYAKTREQFGVKIGSFQAMKHQLADMAVEVEPCRGLVWYAAHAVDRVPEEAAHVAAATKAHLTDRFMQIGRDTVEAHGGIGFTWESDVQVWFKRAMFDRAFLGQPALHRERAASSF